MPSYADIIPLPQLEQRFGKIERKVIAGNADEFRRALPAQIPGICMFIWDEMVDRKLVRDPYKIGPIIHNDYKGIWAPRFLIVFGTGRRRTRPEAHGRAAVRFASPARRWDSLLMSGYSRLMA